MWRGAILLPEGKEKRNKLLSSVSGFLSIPVSLVFSSQAMPRVPPKNKSMDTVMPPVICGTCSIRRNTGGTQKEKSLEISPHDQGIQERKSTRQLLDECGSVLH